MTYKQRMASREIDLSGPEQGGFVSGAKSIWKGVARWCARVWRDIRPGPEAQTGAVWAGVVVVIWAAIVGGLNLKSGFGLSVDFLFAFLIAVLGISIVALLAALLFTITRRLPRIVSGFFIGAFVFVSLLWISPLGFWMAAVLLALEGLLGASIATMRVGFRNAAPLKQVVTIAVCVAAVAANVGLFVFLNREGANEELIRIQQSASAPAQLTIANPADRGPFAVKLLFYGSGNDLRRPEYGRSVAIKTATVDASGFFKDFSGWKANLRKRYWGFGMDKLPLNARVWYPDGPGPFPLALIVHGNHDMSEFSDPGYAYLGELLASRGFILASIDENFLNSGLFHDPPKQQAVRGWMLLEHLRLWHEWNASQGNPFYGKLDLNHVALMGHSRGGEAAATAALFNNMDYYPDDATIRFHYRFPIQSVVAIAPADGQYKPAGEWRIVKDVNYFTLQGANDADVSSFDGSRQWDHVRFSGTGDFFKSELYIYRANHGQFNTVWGRTDIGGPNNWFLNLHSLMKGEDQRRIAKVYISGFLEATLHNRREYVPMFEDYRRISKWLPDTLYVNRYEDASDKVVANYSEDTDVTTTTISGGHLDGENLTVWREGRIPYREGDRGYNGVFLGWNREHFKGRAQAPVGTYTVTLPDSLARDWDLDGQCALTLSIAVTDDKAPPPGKKTDAESSESKQDDYDKPQLTDFTVEAVTSDGVTASAPLSNFRPLLPPFKVRFTKLASIDNFAYKKSSEPIFQTVEVPLAAFAARNSQFTPKKIKLVRLRFDRTLSRVVIISEIGFEHRIGR